MANNRTDKSCYQSDYAPGTWVTASQWLAEQMVERTARWQRERLTIRFWNTERWGPEFRRQVACATKLIETWGEPAVVATFRRKDLEWCGSFDAPQFLEGLEEESQKLRLSERAAVGEVPVLRLGTFTPPTHIGQQSLYAKLE